MYVHKSKLQIQMFSDAKVGFINNKPKSGCNAAIEPRVEKLSAALFLTLTTALVLPSVQLMSKIREGWKRGRE